MFLRKKIFAPKIMKRNVFKKSSKERILTARNHSREKIQAPRSLKKILKPKFLKEKIFGA